MGVCVSAALLIACPWVALVQPPQLERSATLPVSRRPYPLWRERPETPRLFGWVAQRASPFHISPLSSGTGAGRLFSVQCLEVAQTGSSRMAKKGYWIVHVNITNPERYKDYV